MKSVVLVGCVARKKSIRAPAKEIYISSRFKHSRRLAESTGSPWFILSAKHGLLHPDKPIDWYEKTLKYVSERREWTKKVQRQMEKEFSEADKFIILAGKNYFEYLVPWLESRYKAQVHIPMKKISGPGRQLKWLKNEKTL